ncbi:MAG: prepilin peptidase [Clostridiales bacterium]|nr:prepilin peptidase [Clostridiales bacterium]
MLFGKIILGGLLLAGAGTDLARRRIPNTLICIGLSAFAVAALLLLIRGDTASLTGCLGAGALAFAIHLAPWFMRGMGAGDVKLALVIGLLSGWEDWTGFLGMYCAVLLAASGILLILVRKKPKALPLAPFMAAAWYLHHLARLLARL